MKVLWKEICTAILMGAILPGLIINYSALLLNGNAEELSIMERTPEADTAGANQPSISVRLQSAQLSQMDLDTYLTGVVLAEMPADFELEALKAQAVAARTYTIKASRSGGKHGDSSICTNPSCCQAYISREDYLSKGGTEENYEKVQNAVQETSGLVLIYDGELIEATYFSCSGGNTEDAAAVWGTDYPYLRSVISPGEENASHFSDTVCLTPAQFEEATGCNLTGEPSGWFCVKSYTAGGGVDKLLVCGVEYTGKQLRQLLGLSSTIMTFYVDSETIKIVTKGYGHRVGMSQYGADAMAVTGSSYLEILAHYYPGTALVQLT